MNILFYVPHIEGGLARIEEEETRHITAVMRKRAGDTIELTDGKGRWFRAELVEIGKKHCIARVQEQTETPPPATRLHLAVAPTKNIERFEWLIEKAVEIGVSDITPLLCRHSERTVVRHDRLEKVVVAAMKQCLRTWLPVLHPMTPMKTVLAQCNEPQRFIGWCPEDSTMPHLKQVLQAGADTIIFIGPEGDFSPEEVALAQQHHCVPITLGHARLRTETAGIYACSLFNLAQV